MNLKRLFAVGIPSAMLLCAHFGSAQVERMPDPVVGSDLVPLYKVLKYRPAKTAHLSDLSDDLVLVQLAQYDDPEHAKSFLTAHVKLELIAVRTDQNNKTKYRIFLGVYDDMDSARWAIDSFIEQHTRYKRDRIQRIRLGDIKAFIAR